LTYLRPNHPYYSIRQQGRFGVCIMGRQTVSVKVGEFWKRGEFCGHRRTIGGKMFYFGKATDRRTAERQAAALVMAWQGLRATGRTEWTLEAIEAAMSLGGTIQSPLRRTDATASRSDQLSIYDAFTAFVEHLRPRMPHQMSASHFQRLQQSLEWSKRFVKNRAVRTVGYDDLSEIVSSFVARPNSKKTGKPISPYTALHVIQAYRLLFTYLEDSGRWLSPRNWTKAFRVKRTAMFSRQEKHRLVGGINNFTVEELTALYRASADSDLQRLYLLLGLNTGGTQQEISTYLKSEFHLDRDTPYLEHPRNKTGVLGRWLLWPETADAVSRRLTSTPENVAGLAFLSEDGKPLVWYNEKNKMDSVKLVWARLLKKCPTVRPLSFKFLRKTASQIIRDLSDLETSQAFLAHTGQSVAERHYNNRSFEKVTSALLQMRLHLAKMFEPHEQNVIEPVVPQRQVA
jgi:hypothetical protein